MADATRATTARILASAAPTASVFALGLGGDGGAGARGAGARGGGTKAHGRGFVATGAAARTRAPSTTTTPSAATSVQASAPGQRTGALARSAPVAVEA